MPRPDITSWSGLLFRRQLRAALDWLEKSLDNFYPEPESILAEPLFSKIKKTKRFKAMMLKNFPPGWEQR